jgi:hypothetical protein
MHNKNQSMGEIQGIAQHLSLWFKFYYLFQKGTSGHINRT